jgi:hypothetical protein
MDEQLFSQRMWQFVYCTIMFPLLNMKVSVGRKYPQENAIAFFKEEQIIAILAKGRNESS